MNFHLGVDAPPSLMKSFYEGLLNPIVYQEADFTSMWDSRSPTSPTDQLVLHTRSVYSGQVSDIVGTGARFMTWKNDYTDIGNDNFPLIFGLTESELQASLDGTYLMTPEKIAAYSRGAQDIGLDIKKLLYTPKTWAAPKNRPTGTVQLARHYPDSREFFYTLSFQTDPLQFLRILKLYDLYRVAAPKGVEVFHTSKIDSGKSGKYRHYVFNIYERKWNQLPPRIYELFEMLLLGWSLDLRQLAALAASSIPDYTTLQAASTKLSSIKDQIKSAILSYQAKVEVHPGPLSPLTTLAYNFDLQEDEKKNLLAVFDKVWSFVQAQQLRLGAAAGKSADKGALSYQPTPESQDPKFNVMLIPDLVLSEQSGVTTYRDVSKVYNPEMQKALSQPVTDTRMPVKYMLDAPKILASWERSVVDEKGFALPPAPGTTQRQSITPFVLAGVAALLVASQMQG